MITQPQAPCAASTRLPKLASRLGHYAELMRLSKPIGILLLLWPTLWALALAGASWADWPLVSIFVLGVIVMRSAGCVINDFADRQFDSQVARTRNRPLAAAKLKPVEALGLFSLLCCCALLLVLQLNQLTLCYAFAGAALTLIYPFLKRYTHWPQLGLGLAFSWGVPMAFAAQEAQVPWFAWILFATSVLWPLSYDSIYALSDREDDRQIGVKSTVILFYERSHQFIATFQTAFLLALLIVGLIFELKPFYYFSVLLVGFFFLYQQWLIKTISPELCHRAFLNNNWVGLTIFLGILSSL